MPHKKEKSISLLLAWLLLAACAAPAAETPGPTPTPEVTVTPVPTATPTPTPEPTPVPTEEVTNLWGFPIDETHDAFEVPTGGKLGTVLVTVEIGEEGKHQLSVWVKGDLDTPLQTMEAEGTSLATFHDVVDANFDGYMDFGYVWVASARALYYNYWIWNEERGQFELEPQLQDLPEPYFDQTTKTIFCKRIWTWYYENDCFFQWKESELVCIRNIVASRISDESNQYKCVVEALMEKDLVEIYSGTVATSEDSPWALDNIEDKWYDLDYFGS